MELVLATAFKACMGVASGPDILLFKRFQAYWERIDKTTFDSGLTDDVVQPRISAERERIFTFATSQLTSHQSRDDYQELLDLRSYLLELNSPKEFTFVPLDQCTMPVGCRKLSTPSKSGYSGVSSS